MKQVHFADLARADLKQIEISSSREWGADQTQRYMDRLKGSFRRIGDNPAIGAFFGPDKPGLRRLRSGRHLIFYREESDGVMVMRVLHERMDHDHHL